MKRRFFCVYEFLLIFGADCDHKLNRELNILSGTKCELGIMKHFPLPCCAVLFSKISHEKNCWDVLIFMRSSPLSIRTEEILEDR